MRQEYFRDKSSSQHPHPPGKSSGQGRSTVNKSSSQHTQSRKSFVEASTQVLVLGTLHHFRISLFFAMVAWVKIFLSTTPPPVWASTILDPSLGTSIPVTGHPLW